MAVTSSCKDQFLSSRGYVRVTIRSLWWSNKNGKEVAAPGTICKRVGELSLRNSYEQSTLKPTVKRTLQNASRLPGRVKSRVKEGGRGK